MWRACLVAAALLLAVAAPSKQVSGAAQFALWQRYGRAASALLPPRADRFYMTSRYGKRVESVQDGGLPPPMPDMTPDSRAPDPDVRRQDEDIPMNVPMDGPMDGARSQLDDLQCRYIGIGDLYQCRSANDKTQSYNKKLEEATYPTTM